MTTTTAQRSIPGPQGFPLLGVIPRIGRDVLGFFVNAMRQYGDLVRLDMGLKNLYLVTDSDGIKYVLQDNNKNYQKGYDVTKPLIGNGLVSSDGDFWRRQRRLMQPMFHRNKISEFVDVMTGTTDEVVATWQPHLASGQAFDIAEEMTRLTQQVIARTMFSTNVGDQVETLMHAFDHGLAYLNQHMFNPIPGWNKLPTATNRRFWKAVATLDEMMYGLINARRQSSEDPGDLLSMLLEARDEETGESMSDQQIRDEVMTIFFAGHETTASTLSWAWWLLAQHPEVESRLVAEFEQVLGGRTPVAADYPKLTYTRQVIDEVLRLYPPAWMFARVAIQDDEVSGYHIPAGTMLMFSPYVTHRRPDYWIDAERFNPDRFAPGADADRPRYAYYPFGGGPRLCIGKDFALVEATLVLAAIYQRFTFRLAEDNHTQAQPIATLRPRPGVRVHARLRTAS